MAEVDIIDYTFGKNEFEMIILSLKYNTIITKFGIACTEVNDVITNEISEALAANNKLRHLKINNNKIKFGSGNALKSIL